MAILKGLAVTDVVGAKGDRHMKAKQMSEDRDGVSQRWIYTYITPAVKRNI